jgi:hypothetical protein
LALVCQKYGVWLHVDVRLSLYTTIYESWAN